MNTESQSDSHLHKWTVMVYLAGDNNLEKYGIKDLGEMKAAGSTDQVAIVAQFDRMSDQITRRYYLKYNQSLDADCVAQLPEINTGDPEALIDFITWACQVYPADHYALILWNHGTGWKDEDIYYFAEERGVIDKVSRGQVRRLASGKPRRALFKTSLKHAVVEMAQSQRAILFDDSSTDFLDNQELSYVLQRVKDNIGQSIALLGFDACLMNMLEVNYQVKDTCDLVVGSQENEPGDGWPYDAILAFLIENPQTTPAELARNIVQAYCEFYQTRYLILAVTQSAVDLTRIEGLASTVDALGHVLTNSVNKPRSLGLLFGTLRAAQTFSDRDYVDLAHFCKLWADKNSTGEIGAAARQVVSVLDGENSPLIAESHCGPGVSNAHGLSIYLPGRVLSPLYHQLEFAKKFRWDGFLRAFVHPQ